MPFTPYHFGPSGFIGLVFRKWIDIPVFVLANVIVDIEVAVIWLFGFGSPWHRYCHTLLIGTVVGVLWGAVAYPFRRLFKRVMQIFSLPYQTSFSKMVISGILGVWFHVLIDGAYHSDVRILWPNKTLSFRTMIQRYANHDRIEDICVIFFLAAIVVYMVVLVSAQKQKKIQETISSES
jgi:H+/Cl- antiporter ClcA